MIIHGIFEHKRLTISSKPQGINLSLEDETSTEVFSFDHAGRLWTALMGDVSYRRGLDGTTIARWTDFQGLRHRRRLTSEEAEALAQQCQVVVYKVREGISNGKTTLEDPLPPDTLTSLASAALHDASHRADDIEKYRKIYLPVGILPPDQYGAVVLQASEGCSFNRCTFCSFYRDRPFRIKSPTEYEAHCEQVKTFLGAGLSLRRTIFLGDANSLIIPTSQLIEMLEITRRHFDVDALGGIYAFLDGVSGKTKSSGDFRRLSALGLQRVYIGLESGNEALLKYLNKPSTPDSIVHTVQALKQGGVAVGIIVLLGAGGKKYAPDHVRDTIKVINRLHLDAEDILYFSELVESEGMEYQMKAYEESLQPLYEEERLAQGLQIEQALKFSGGRGIPHIARYDIREFVY